MMMLIGFFPWRGTNRPGFRQILKSIKAQPGRWRLVAENMMVRDDGVCLRMVDIHRMLTRPEITANSTREGEDGWGMTVNIRLGILMRVRARNAFAWFSAKFAKV
jgi:hypothetical protein